LYRDNMYYMGPRQNKNNSNSLVTMCIAIRLEGTVMSPNSNI